MRLSVFVIACDRLSLLQNCCRSIARYLPPESEAIVVINGAHPRVREWLRGWHDSRFRVLEVAEEPRAGLRNRAFELCRGEIVHFLDDDVIVSPDLFDETLSRFASDEKLAILGGPNLTPPGSTLRQMLFGAVMTSFFAAPRVRARYRASSAGPRPATEHELILCNLAVRRALIPRGLRFESHMKSGEENLFLYRCRARGLKAIASGRAFLYHARRSDLRSFLRQVFLCGYGRAQQTRIAPRSCHPLFLAPALAMAGLSIALFHPVLLGSLILGHLVVSFLAALASPTLRALGPVGLGASVPLTGLVHLAYGTGFWSGALHRPHYRKHFSFNIRRKLSQNTHVADATTAVPQTRPIS